MFVVSTNTPAAHALANAEATEYKKRRKRNKTNRALRFLSNRRYLTWFD